MKSIFLTVLSVFALVAFTSANDLVISAPMKSNPSVKNVELSPSERGLIRIPPKFIPVTVDLIKYNIKMRPKFEDKTIDHMKYKKRVQRFARRAQRKALENLDKPEEEDDGEDLILAGRKLESDSSELPTLSRDACGRCRASCSGAAVSCRGGCLYTGPEGVVECEIAWAVVAAGCFGVCATRYC